MLSSAPCLVPVLLGLLALVRYGAARDNLIAKLNEATYRERIAARKIERGEFSTLYGT